MARSRTEADRTRLQFGMALLGQGRMAEAEAIFRGLLRQNPADADALYHLGLLMIATGKAERGADLIGRSIRLNPGFAPAYCNRGAALAALKRPAEALACYDKAVALQPGFADAHYNRGILLGEIGRTEDAVRAFEAALSAQPAFPDALNGLGNLLNGMGRHQDALIRLDAAIGLEPVHAKAHCNRGNALLGLDQPAEALASFDRALSLQPDMAEAWCNRGEALAELQRPLDAQRSFERALALRPDFAEAEFGLSLVLLAQGDYAAGFRHHEARWKRLGFPPPRTFRRPPWLGRDNLAGRTLFIHPELFLGDMIQFCRYAKRAEAAGASVALAAPAVLREVLQSLGAGISLLNEDEVPARYDLHCPLMSLPLAFATTLETVPHDVPYLHADPARVSAWLGRIGRHGFRIGVCWHGSAQRQALGRSFPVTMLRDIAQLPGVRLISLQAGPGSEQRADLPSGMVIEDYPADTPDGGLRPFADDAAIMTVVDLVISLDSAAAHLAGALGRPLWVALRHVPDWRWGLAGQTTPWYPTARLFRQTRRNDWGAVFAAMHAALRERVAEPDAIRAADTG